MIARICVVCGAPAVYNTSHCREHRNEYQRKWARAWRATHPYQRKPKRDRRLKHTPPLPRHMDGFFTLGELQILTGTSYQNVHQAAARYGWRNIQIGRIKFFHGEGVRGWLAMYPEFVGVELEPGLVAHVARDIDEVTLEALRVVGHAAYEQLANEGAQ